jgi:hypothetical protein
LSWPVQQRRLHLFGLSAHSAKLNGAVERTNRIHTEKSYQVTD